MRFTFLASVLTLAGCATTAPQVAPTLPTSVDYAPLGIGASWTYAMEFPGQKGERTVTIMAQEEGYFLDDQRGELKHTQEGLRDRQRYLIRAPIAVGTQWKSVLSASAVEHYEIKSVGEPCGSLAGRFEDCLVVESSIRRDDQVTLINQFTWVRGVGLAKIETWAEIAGKGRVRQTEQNLVRYGLGGRGPAVPADDDGPNTWE